MMKEETTFQETKIEEVALLPSVTFCQHLPAEAKEGITPNTMEEALEAINDIKNDVKAALELKGSGWIPLDNTSALTEKFNVEPENIWSYGFHPTEFEKVEPCATISLEMLKLAQLEVKFAFHLRSETNIAYKMEVHDHGQGNYNYKWNYLEGYKYIMPLKRFEIYA